MFGGRFSHIRFSLRDTVELEVKVSVFFVETTRNLISLGENTPVEHNFRCNTGNQTILTRGVRLTNNFVEDVKSKANAGKDYSFSVEYKEDTFNKIHLSSDISVNHNFQEEIENKTFVGQNVALVTEYVENIDSGVFVVKNTPVELNLREAVFGKLNIETVEKDMIIITVSIPPESELRIDSENFEVTLDGKSILHQYETDDWVNIMRNTIDMTVMTGGGDLDGKLLYLERFL